MKRLILFYFLRFIQIRHGTIIYVGRIYSYERMYVICIWNADVREEGLRKSFEKKVRDTKTFDGAENFSKSRGTSEIFKVRVPRWFQGIWSPLKVAFPERFLNHKLNLTPRRSLTIYMAADNEIYCWTKVENFWRVSTTFCRGASAEIRRPNGYFY